MFFLIKATPQKDMKAGGWRMKRGGARAVIIDKRVASKLIYIGKNRKTKKALKCKA